MKMNRTLGTTIILSSSSDQYLKHFVSVLVYLDHGHISKIRPGVSRKPNRNSRSARSIDQKNTIKIQKINVDLKIIINY